MFNESQAPENTTEKKRTPPSFPDLCHKCGRCCVSATTFRSYADIQNEIALGNEDAKEFLRVFEPFPSIEEARKVVPEQVDRVIHTVLDGNGMNLADVTFYHCRYVTEEGMCGIYETRPRACREAPYNGWSMMPPGCGFEGWQFEQRERQRAEIRKLKEIQFRMEKLSDDGVHTPSGKMTLQALRDMVTDSSKAWRNYGADDW